jgi:N-acyl homoserine lactone hydrolase
MSTSPQDFNAQIIEGFITAHLAATVAGLPVYVHTIEHADGVVLVDTGMLDSTPGLDEECEPVPMPENIPRDVVRVINTHLHFDHCGGNRLFPGVPIHVQRLELQAPHDPHEWVDFAGATYVEQDGEAEVLPGIRLLPTPGHTRGHQSVLVDTPDGLVVIGGDVAYTFHELGSGATEGQRRVLALAAPTWLTHAEGGRKFLARSRTTTRAGARALETTLRRTRGARESSARNAGALKTSRRAGVLVTLAVRRAPVNEGDLAEVVARGRAR